MIHHVGKYTFHRKSSKEVTNCCFVTVAFPKRTILNVVLENLSHISNSDLQIALKQIKS